MNLLEYSVAWIDDQPAQATGYEVGLRSKLARQGLDLRVQWVITKPDLDAFLEALNEDSGYDLILVDWGLGQMIKSGATVAKSIRDQQSYANVIFYSAATLPVLRAEIAKHLIDGVWCVNRSYFSSETWHVVQSSLRRIDLNAMRGLFVAAVAEFDQKMKGALIEAHNLLDDEAKKSIKDSFVRRKVNYAHQKVVEFEKLDFTVDIWKVLQGAGTYELFTALQELNALAGFIDPPHRDVTTLLGSFEDDIITPRNDLAHGQTSVKGGKKTITRGGRTYDWPKFSDLRAKLSAHHENISLIRDKYVKEIAEKNAKSKT